MLGALLAGIALADTVAPMTLAVLMLLPLSAFEATAALPAAAVTVSRARVAARRLRALTEPDDTTRRRPDVAPCTSNAETGSPSSGRAAAGRPRC